MNYSLLIIRPSQIGFTNFFLLRHKTKGSPPSTNTVLSLFPVHSARDIKSCRLRLVCLFRCEPLAKARHWVGPGIEP